MNKNHRLPIDLCALGLFASGVLAIASLVTYDPADPPSSLVYPPRAEVTNACGRMGAWIAHALFSTLGFTAWLAAASVLGISVMLVARRRFDQPMVRSLGWAASLAALAIMTALALPDASPGPEIGAGGYLGAMGLALLDSHFALAGTWIVAVSLLVAGLLLCTDYLFLHLAAGATGATVASGSSLLRLGRWLPERRVAPMISGKRHFQKIDETGVGEGLDAANGDDQEEYEYEDEEAEDGDEYEYEYEEDEDGETSEGEVDWDDDDQDADDDAPVPDAAIATLKVRTPAPKLGETPEAVGEPRGDVADQGQSAVEQSLVGPAAIAAGAVAVAGGLKGKLKSALGIKKSAGRSASSAEAAPIPEAPKPSEKSAKQAVREEIITKLEEADSRGVDDFDYALPPLDLLLPADNVSYEEHEREVRRKARILEKTFRNFGFNVKVVEIETGPVIAQYEVQLEAGLRLSKITGLADDLAIALRVPSVRIVAPIPGKNTVGIEVPNENRQLVRLRQVIEETNGQAKRMKIPIFLGQDVAGNPMAVDLASLPHLLIAGRTGTGKSVCLNSIIVSILMSRGPDEVRMLMIDPKMVELSGYKKLPHLMHPVVTDMRKAEAILAWAVDKMEERYALLARAGVRHVSVYNQLSEAELRDRLVPESETEWEQVPRNLPFIVIVADEIADLMMTSGKEVEQHIIRLAQKSRAVGIHLILATQKPTVDVITGLIKSNLPARIAFQVASRTDSRVVLDEMGADKLLGNGDMLFLSPGTSMLLRGQGTYLSDDEITRVTDYVATDAPQFARELIELKTKDEQDANQPGAKLANRDDLYEAAVDVVVRERRGSVSLLQRCLGIGYGRAARLIDYMAEDGIVGEYNGSQAREVAISIEEWEAKSRGGAEPAPPDDQRTPHASAEAATAPPLLTAVNAPPKPKRYNRIVPEQEAANEVDEAIEPRPARKKTPLVSVQPMLNDESDLDEPDEFDGLSPFDKTPVVGGAYPEIDGDDYDAGDQAVDVAESDAEDVEENDEELDDEEFEDEDADEDEDAEDAYDAEEDSPVNEEDGREEDDADEYEYEYEYEEEDAEEDAEEDGEEYEEYEEEDAADVEYEYDEEAEDEDAEDAEDGEDDQQTTGPDDPDVGPPWDEDRPRRGDESAA